MLFFMVNQSMSSKNILIFSTCLYMMFLTGSNFGKSPTENEPEKETFLSRQQYEICRDKLFTKYPNEIKQKQWRECLHGND